MEWQNYKALSEGRIEVYGNSCVIHENPYGLDGRSQFLGRLQRLKNDKPQYHPPKRRKGDIKRFSPSSNLRLKKKFNKVDFTNRPMPYFCTLTYPSRYPEDRKEYKSDLDTMLKRLKREFGEIQYIWRLEAQKRGAPHYHFIIYFKQEMNLEYLRRWISQNWFEVVQRKWDEKDEKHLRAGTNCKRVKNYRQLIAYVSKYMGKAGDDKLIDQGRYWASSRNWGDYIGEILLNGIQLIQFRRLLERYLRKDNQRFAQRIPRTQNIEIFAYWEFILRALNWVQFSY